MKSIPGNLSDGDESGIINVMPPIIYFSGLSQSVINYYMYTLSSIDENTQSQLTPLTQEEIIIVFINWNLHLEIKTNLA